MIILPDGVKIEMQWKQCKYDNNKSYIVFQIIPMLKEKDIVIVPNKNRWKLIQDVFSFEEREEIIFLLERINWKRDIQILEMDVEPCVNKEFDIRTGMIEMTNGYITLTKENLFDIDSKLNKKQVKELYCKLEEKFAMMSEGVVEIPREILIEGSVFKEICIPAFERNKNIQLVLK